MDIWENCKKNLICLRNHYNLTEQQVADGAKISLGDYRSAETVSPAPVFEKLVSFWYENYLVTPNDLLLFELNEARIKIREDRFKRELERFVNN